MKHIVYGNGESRPKDKIIGGEWVTTWGCNAIYRDFTVDNLVSVDYGMQQEIYESGYALKNKCWFTDWEILPPIDTSMIALGEGVPVYETEQNGKQLCVIQGNTHFTPEDAIKDMMKENPNIDTRNPIHPILPFGRCIPNDVIITKKLTIPAIIVAQNIRQTLLAS